MEENKQVVAEWKATNQERLTEIKSFNPELYSAINLALNYLNKSLTGEELPKEVEEVKVQPAQQKGFWRIMTEKEFKDKYSNVKDVAGWNTNGGMDWMFGIPVKDLIKDDLTEEEIGYKIKDGSDFSLETNPSKDKNNKSWFIFPEFIIFDTSNVKPKVNEPQTQLSGWRIKTKEELKKENLDDLGIPDRVWEEIYGKPIEDLYASQSQINDAIRRKKANLKPPAFTKGIASSYMLLPKYFSPYLPTTIPNLVYRFKTLDEMRDEGLGTAGGSYYGVNEETIKKYAGKSLDELYDAGYLRGNTIKQVVERIINNKKNIIDGYEFPIAYFTDKPLTAEATSEFKLSIETIPATLKRSYTFSTNKGDRKSPSQSAGDLYKTYAGLPAAKLELLNTFFKGNDGVWWNLQQVKGTWKWERSSPQPSQTSTIVATKTQETETKQEWTPKDLVGKILLFSGSGKKYRVEKFTRNNPKNKEYKLRDLTSPTTPEVTYQISMSIIKTWLDGNVSKGARIIEETPTGTNYSTWTQIQLNQKRREISDALIAFEEDDPEYKELKDQLDIIDTFID